MSKRRRRHFTKEQKKDAVQLARSSEESNSAKARSLGINESTLRNWISKADIDDGKVNNGGFTTDEKAENRLLKREFKRVTMERDFLKKAVAYFAKETEDTK